ncbi:MAG: M50 family metallopeptidase [Anaerolineae bacterium]
MVLTILFFVLMLGFLVLVHELGHFVAARRSGIVVEEFGIGFPPRLVTLFERDGVKYTLNAIPLGGFVRMKGEDADAGPGSFTSMPKRVRARVLLAGPAMNLLAAFVLFATSAMVGRPMPVSGQGVIVTGVVKGSAAEEVGIREGDRILAVDGQEIEDADAFVSMVTDRAGRLMALTIQRDGQTLTVEATPRPLADDGRSVLGVNIRDPMVIQRETPWRAVTIAALLTSRFVLMTVFVPVLLVRGLIPASDARPIGPLGIAQLAGGAVSESVASGMAFPVLEFMAIISAALAVTNLLPLPALDGGRLVFVILEWIRGKPIDPEKEGLVHLVGMVLLITLMIVISYQDLTLGVPQIEWPRPDM